MAKKKFSQPERFAVWKVYDGYCFWCGHPVRFKDMHVDHVLAETLADDPKEYKTLLNAFGLPEDFSVNDFGNWVASCPACNTKKGATTYDPVPMFLSVLRTARERGEMCRETAARILNDRELDRVLGKLAALVAAGRLPEQEIGELLDGLVKGLKPTPALLPGRKPNLHLFGDWEIIEEKGNIAYVRGPKGFGVTPIVPNPDPSWECPYCGSYGPWDGIICRSCNHRSEPD